MSLLALALPVSSRAASVTLAWNANGESNLGGYRLYYGGASRAYSANVQVASNSTNATVNTLVAGQRYYFAVTALSTDGLESDYSTEVSYDCPSGPNSPPTLNVLSDVTINEDSGVQTVSLSGISSGAATENQPLTISAVSSNPGLIVNPTVTYTSPNSTGSLRFAPVANGHGTATITVTVNDGQATNNLFSRTFVVNVNSLNDPPTLNALGNLSLIAGAPAQTVNLTGIGSGAPNEVQALLVTASSSNPSLIPNPTVSYVSPNATGSLQFTPLSAAGGTATITVTVNDGQAQNNLVSRSFTVTVAPNQPPTLATISNRTINEDAGPQSVSLTGIGSGSAAETQTLTVTATSSNPGLIPTPTVIYTSPNTTGTLSFASVTNGNGTATITVTVNDGQNANNLVSRTFTVTVTAVNDAPTLAALGNISILEDASVQTVSLTGIGTGAANETQVLTVTATSSHPSLIPNPTVTYTSPNAAGALSFAPSANANGTATITVTVNDGQTANNTVARTFTVTVGAVNDAPTLSALINLTILEDAGPQTVNLTGIGAGPGGENQTVTISAVSSNPALIPNPTVNYTSPNTTGALNFTSAAEAGGSATITVTVNDGQATNNTMTRTFTVTVNPVNDPPTLNALAPVSLELNASAQTINLTGISSGAPNESQPLTVTATSSNPGLIPNPTVSYVSPNPAGTLSFRPTANYSGTATITVTIDDGQAQNNTFSQTFLVSVATGNQQPTLAAIVDRTIDEDAGTQTVNLSGIGSGAVSEIQTLTVTATSGNPGLVPHPTIVYTSPNSTAALNFTPAPDAHGSAVLTVTVNDGQGVNNTVSRSFTVTVNPVNDPPTLAALGNVSVSEDAGAQTVNLTGIGSGAVNESQTMAIVAVSSNPSLVPNPVVSYASPATTGTLVFTPAANAVGTATITVTVNDGQSTNNTVRQTFTISVSDVNDPPTLAAVANVSINEDAGFQTVNLTGLSAGPGESQGLTITATSSNPTLIPNPTVVYNNPDTTGTLNFSPAANSNGTATITVTVNDGQPQNNTFSRTFTLTVNPVNDVPVLNPIPNLALTLNAPAQTVNLTGIGSGAANESQTLTLTATSSNPGLIPNPTVSYASPNSTGTLSLRPATGSNGTATITVTVNDGQAQNNQSSRTFTVSVVAGNQPPTINPLPDLVLNEDAPQYLVNFSGLSAGPGESQALTVTAVSSDPTLIPPPVVRYDSPASGGYFTFTPVPNGFGTAWITVTVNDGQAVNNTASRIIQVTVNPVNDVPTLNTIADLDFYEDTGSRVVTMTGVSTGATNENQTLVITAISSNPGVIPHPEVIYTSPASTGTLIINPATNAVGSATITVTANDGDTTRNVLVRTFYVAVRGINDLPGISPIPDQTLAADQSTGPIPFTVSDPDTSMTDVRLTVSSSDPVLLPPSGLVLGGSGSNRTITVTPAPGRSGTAVVTLAATDGWGTNREAFVVTVGVNEAPVVSPIADQVIDASTTLADVPFQVGDAETPAANLLVNANSLNQAVLPNSGIELSGTGANRRIAITPAKGRTGQVAVVVMVSDGVRQTERSFQVTVRTVKSRLTLNKRGRGKIEPDLNGQTLTVGATYTIAATPDAGEVFDSWSGHVSGSRATLTFVMVPNMVIDANFQEDPYWRAQGTYHGLITEADEVRHERSGNFSLASTSRGSYSGKLQIGRGKHTVKGLLSRDGRATNVVLRPGQSSLTVEVALEVGAAPGRITGRVTDGSWVAQLEGDRHTFNTKTNPAPFAGTFTLVIPAGAGTADGPIGAGHGTVKVDGNGLATFVGMLADGTKAVQRVPWSAQREWPFYLGLYKGGGSVLGWLAVNPTDDELSGLVSWIKPAMVSKYYAGGLTNESQVLGSAYAPPTSGQASGGNPVETDLVFNGANLSETVTGRVTLLPNGKIVTQGNSAVKFGVSPTTGLFKGTVADPVTHKPRAFTGVVLQKWNIGAGLILGFDEVGLVEMAQQ